MTNADQPYFRDLRDELCQGDIIANIPFGFVDDVAVCRVDNGKDYGKARYRPVAEVASPAAFDRKNGALDAIHLRVRLWPAMVLWPDCAIDEFDNKARDGANNVKADKMFAGVAPLINLDKYHADEHDGIKDGKRPTLFYVPAFPEVGIPESVVDFRRILPVKQSLLISARMASVSDVVRDALTPHINWFLTVTRLNERMGCPSCGVPLRIRDLVPLPIESTSENKAS